MALIPSINSSGPAPSKVGKTKAKLRYLKAKKNRSKRAKKHVGLVAGRGAPSASPHPIDDAEALSGSDSSDSNGGNDAEVTPPLPVKESKLPKKKRRLEADISSDPRSPDNTGNLLGNTPVTADRISPDAPPVPSVAALPRFPLPTQPEPPSPSILYLQGMDQAMIEAEVVHPSRTVTLSSDSAEDISKLSGKTRQRLAQLGITELFAVQVALLPFLLPSTISSRSLYLPYTPLRDVCVSAPTGSGKTLAYVLPIVETLSTRTVTRLRALVVLPTRDLVLQVRETFEAVGKGTGLKIGTVTGQHSFSQEQSQLVGERSIILEGGQSKVDILICTPGRLMDHLQGTPNFSLQHLRFLVIDEADRLVTEAFQDWLAQVLAATNPGSFSTSESSTFPLPIHSSAPYIDIPTSDALNPAWLPTSPSQSYELTEQRRSSCQRLLFSATLTRDPSKIAALNLKDAKYFVVGGAEVKNDDDAMYTASSTVGETFTFPLMLREHMIVCDTTQKPLILLYLMHTAPYHIANALVFTKSADSTARLVKLIHAFEESYQQSFSTSTSELVREENSAPSRPYIAAESYSSDLTGSQRKSILERFKNGKITILVCSDLISRGIDISHVSNVVSYDVPLDMRKYVHRVGRTARAGRSGNAWSLVEKQEARHFKQMMSGACHLDNIKKLKISEKQLDPFQKHYEVALEQLKVAYGR